MIGLEVEQLKIKKTRWLYCLECHNTVFGSMWSAICAQGVYFLPSTMHRVTCLRLNDVSALYTVSLTFSLQFRPAFLPCRSSRRHSGVLDLPNIGRCRKFGYISCMGHTV